MSVDLPCGCSVGRYSRYVHGVCARHRAAERTLPKLDRPYTVPELEEAARKLDGSSGE